MTNGYRMRFSFYTLLLCGHKRKLLSQFHGVAVVSSAVNANVQKIPVFFQKFRLFDLIFATKAMINSHILLKHKDLQK